MNVYEAACARIDRMLREFDYCYVSFSGGKDSGVLLNLTRERAAKLGKRFGVFHIDYEAQYQQTTDYVATTLDELRGAADVFHVCLPIAAQCATSMHQSHWTPWDGEQRALWTRELPANSINESNAPEFFRRDMWDYELQERIGSWIGEQVGAKSVCCLVGIRSEESLNRWRTIWRDDRVNMRNGLKWTRTVDDGVTNAYPIHDWTVEDVWTANARFGWKYNALYDLFHLAGVPAHKMRVASPFNDCATESLHLYRAIDPQTWGKMIGRVNGVNFAGIYGGTTAMGWKSIKLPDGHTWKSYMEFLLSTLPEAAASNYRAKLEASKKSWVVGGAMEASTIAQLEAEGAPIIRTGHTNNRSKAGKEVVRFEDYLDDTSIDDFSRIPTYKRMCICIMKNDHSCKYMGFAQNKIERERRASALTKYGNL